MLVGEIGIPRREYLYELEFWEILLIIRGYSNRNHSGWEQARLVAYNAAHCMGSKHQPQSINQWLTFPWEKAHIELPTDEEVNETREKLQRMNEMMKCHN